MLNLKKVKEDSLLLTGLVSNDLELVAQEFSGDEKQLLMAAVFCHVRPTHNLLGQLLDQYPPAVTRSLKVFLPRFVIAYEQVMGVTPMTQLTPVVSMEDLRGRFPGVDDFLLAPELVA